MIRLVLLAGATFISEDLTCLAAGVMVANGQLGFLAGTLACLVGIVAGDILLFLAGRFIGTPAMRLPLLRRCFTGAQLATASQWLIERGAAVILLSRFVPGLRLPTYFAAGLLRTNFWRFSLYFVLAAALWTPLLVGFTALLGAAAVRSALDVGGSGAVAAVFVCAAWVGFRVLLARAPGFRLRRRIAGFLRRVAHWEFWPPWAAYLPLVPYFAWLAIRHRSLTLFTAANPGIPSGGFVGESKSEILDRLDPAGVPAYALIPAALAPGARIRRAVDFMARRGLGFPIVLKPDKGERGSGVSIVRSQTELTDYLQAAPGDTIIQEFVDGLEFGVFYCRFPKELSGRILSITAKVFPEVVGDGRSTIEELILRDSRAVCLAPVYLSGLKRLASEVPASGDRVPLAELGSHCRGAVFMNAGHLRTLLLEAAIDRAAKAHPGFFFGRFDVRSESAEAFTRGSFKVIELNGVSAEATHIYDPAVSVVEAYRVMFRHWRLAFEIGALNHRLGAMPTPERELAGAILERLRRRRREPAKEVDARAVEVMD